MEGLTNKRNRIATAILLGVAVLAADTPSAESAPQPAESEIATLHPASYELPVRTEEVSRDFNRGAASLIIASALIDRNAPVPAIAPALIDRNAPVPAWPIERKSASGNPDAQETVTGIGGFWFGEPSYYNGLLIKAKKHPEILHNAQVLYEVAKAAGMTDAQAGKVQDISYREAGLWTGSGNLKDASYAYGLGQADPGDKMAHFGADWLTNPVVQAEWMISYIYKTYGGPDEAWAYWEAHLRY